MADDIATLGFSVNTGGLHRGERALTSYAATGERTEKRMTTSVGEMNKSFGSMSGMIGMVSTALAGIGLAKLGGELVTYSDEWKGLSSQLRQVTDSESELIAARTTLLAVSRDTRSELTNTVQLYAELTRGTKGLDISQKRMIGVTTTLNNLFVSGGKPISEVNGAIRQLNQGLAAGALRGDEFNSVAEGAPKIMDALAAKLMMTRGELREFAATGGITSQILIDSLESYSKEAQKLADQTEKTFAQSAQAAKTNALEYVGNSELINSAANSVGETIERLSENISALVTAAKAGATVIGVGLVFALAKSTAATVMQITADLKAVDAARAAGIARATIAVSAANSAAVMAASEVALAESRVVSTRFALIELDAETALERSRLAAQISQKGRLASLARMSEIRLANLSITKQLTVAESQLSAATLLASRTQAGSAAAIGSLALATGVATRATTLFGVAIRFAMGPWGLLLTALGAAAAMFVSTKSASDDLETSIGKQEKAVRDLESAYKDKTAAELDNILVKSNEVAMSALLERYEIEKKLNAFGAQSTQSPEYRAGLTDRLEEINKLISEMDSKTESTNKLLNEMFDAGMKSIEWISGLESAAPEKMTEEFLKLKTAIEGFETPLQKLQGKLKTVIDAVSAGTIESTDKTKMAIASLKSEIASLAADDIPTIANNKQILSLKDMQSQLGMTTEQLFLFKQAQQSLANNDTDNIAAEIQKQAEAYLKLKTITDFDETIESLEELSLQQQLTADDYEVHAAVMRAIDQGMTGDQITEIENRIRAIQEERNAINDLGKDVANPFDQMIKGANEAASAMSGMFESGSKEAKQMAVAMAALNLIAGVGAILTQGKGDPYSAFGRMTAMAALVSSLGVAVGGIGGGFDDESKANQEAQGLNSWGEKSESIANAIDMTASATEKLVGINTNMLKALQSMQAGISAAAGLVFRDTKSAEFTFDAGEIENVYAQIGMDFTKNIPVIGGLMDMLNFIPNYIGKLLGGKSSVVDSGIKILGGTLSEMVEGASVFAFQETKYKKYRWSSTKRKTEMSALDDASKQFSLVFESLADSVYEGGIALGMGGAALEDAINNFKIETITISLKDLSVEDQQAEIEAVFSTIFDNLAGSVIPFVKDFQQTGEGIGETLSRIATQVAIAEFSVKNLGIELGDKLANPKLYAEIADNLSTLTGGLESFAEKISSFVDGFAPDSVKLSIASDALTESLNSVGLVVPSTAEGFWALMESLNGTTAAGQEQIAALLNSQDVASTYYDLLKEADDELDAFNDSLQSVSDSLRSAVKSIYGITAESASNSLNAALSAARMGDFSKALNLDTSGFKLDQSSFSSLADFNVAQAEVANRMLELANLTGKQATVEEMTLTEAQKQTELLASINNNYVPAQTVKSDNVIMMDEIKLLRAEMAASNAYQKQTALNTKNSADSLARVEIGGVEIRA
jgi:tape measure domain-containing protein